MIGTARKRPRFFPAAGALATAAGVLVATLLACGRPAHETDVVAVYDGGTVDRREYESWLAYKGVPDDATRRLAFAEKIALTEAHAARALEAGWDTSPPVARSLEAAERRVLTRALRRHLAAEIVLPREEIDRLLDEKRDKLVKPGKVRLRNLFKELPPGAGAEERGRLREEMERLRARLLAGEDFAVLARAESDSLSRHRGGRLGAVAPGQLHPEIEEIAFALGPGEISEVIETRAGFTLLRCDAVVDARTLSEAEARQRIRDFQTRRAVEDRWRELRTEMVAATEIGYDLEAMRNPGTSRDELVGRVGGREVSLAEMDGLLRAMRAGRVPDGVRERQVLAALEGLAFGMGVAERARRLGLAERPEVAAALSWARSEVLLTEAVRRRAEDELEPPTETELREFFAEHPRVFRRPPAYDLSVLRLAVDPESPREQVLAAEEGLAALRAGDTTFAAAARASSQHPSSEAGGRLGWVPRPRVAAMGPAVLRTVSDMAAGDTSEVVLQDRGLWIVHLHDTRPAVEPSFEEVATEVEARVGTRRGNELAAQIERELIEALDVRLVEN